MASTIKIKNSSTAGAAPTASDLVQGELAVNVTDKRIFTENSGGTVVELGTNPSSITLPDGSASAPTLLHSGDTNTGIFFPAADTIALTTGGTERARIDSSGNVGIGASSPSQKLVIADGNILLTSSSSTDQYVEISTSATNSYSYVKGSGKNASATARGWRAGYSPVTDTLNIVAATGIDVTTGLRIDYSGNLGLGVTPSAWGTGKAIEVGYAGNALWTLSSGDVRLMANAYYNGTNYIYSSTNYASYYRQDSGRHIWLNAASGTAGGTISFTQAMTLDASGRLGIGTTSPATVLNVSASSAGSFATNPIITIYDTNASASARNFGIGVGSAGQLGFFASSTQGGTPSTTASMTLDSSGNLLVGQTSGGSRLVVQGTSGAASCDVGVGANGNNAFSFRNASNTYVGSITVNASTTAFNTSSDYRLKENIAPMTGALSVVQQLKPCTYTWKATGENSQGFIAHELAEVVPDAVTGEKDAVDADGNPKYQGIDTSFLVATLTAAIQEQQAIITSLTARITALEA